MATTTETPQETEQERKVREEEEEHERQLETEREADAKAHDDEALFDKTHYDDPELSLPPCDGEGVDKIAVRFAGRVLLNRSDPADVDLIRRLKLGHDITLMVEAKCSGKGHGFTTNKDGDLDAVVLEATAKVENVYRATVPEE